MIMDITKQLDGVIESKMAGENNWQNGDIIHNLTKNMWFTGANDNWQLAFRSKNGSLGNPRTSIAGKSWNCHGFHSYVCLPEAKPA